VKHFFSVKCYLGNLVVFASFWAVWVWAERAML
jgi:hypothetical protein